MYSTTEPQSDISGWPEIAACLKQAFQGGELHLRQHRRLIFSEIYRLDLRVPVDLRHKLVVKRYLENESTPGREIQQEFEVLRFLRERFSLLGQSFGVVEPLMCDKRAGILVTREFPGDTLHAELVRQARWRPRRRTMVRLEQLSLKCGLWLKWFQNFTRRKVTPVFDPEPFEENLRVRLQEASPRLGAALTERSHRFVERTLARTGGRRLELVGSHRDFTPWNVLASGVEIRVIDFDRFSMRGPYEDLTLFLATLLGSKSVVGLASRHVDRLARAFIRGYGRPLPGDLLSLFLFKNLLRCLNRIDTDRLHHRHPVHQFYERFRKQQMIRVYLDEIERLTRQDALWN